MINSHAHLLFLRTDPNSGATCDTVYVEVHSAADEIVAERAVADISRGTPTRLHPGTMIVLQGEELPPHLLAQLVNKGERETAVHFTKEKLHELLKGLDI